MNISRLIKQLEKDEGIRNKVYLDSLGYKTVGVGHLIKEDDPEYLRNLEVGDKITGDMMSELLFSDVAKAIQDAVIIFWKEWESLPSEVQEIVVNMLFNLGRTRFLKFKKMIAAIYAKDWKKASEEMLDSRWATQVGSRAKRLSSRMASVGE